VRVGPELEVALDADEWRSQAEALASGETGTVQRSGFSIRQLSLTLFVGIVIGLGAFLLSSQQPPFFYLGFCHPGIAQGFDPWTGLPHGATLECVPSAATAATQPSTVNLAAPSDLATRRAVPVPVGFGVGVSLAFVLVSMGNRQRRHDLTVEGRT
jgi:hypothetical protein